MDHRVMGVIGASGGLGASTLAVALATRGARSVGASVAVDAAPGACGLDVTACVEHREGLRWADLGGVQGALDGPALLGALPHEQATRVLAGMVDEVPQDVVEAALAGLGRTCGLTVLDLGRSLHLAHRCTDMVVLCGTTARQLADGAALAARLLAAGDGQDPVARPVGATGRPIGLVVRLRRGDRVEPEAVALHLDLPLAGTLGDDPRAAADADRGRPPGERRVGALARVVDELLDGPHPQGGQPVGDARLETRRSA